MNLSATRTTTYHARTEQDQREHEKGHKLWESNGLNHGPILAVLGDSRAVEVAMILECAVLNVKPGAGAEFEAAFATAEPIIASARGYLSHELLKCTDATGRYLLLVRWRSIADHTEGFRGSPPYQEWKRLLHHFYDPFPTVEHYQRRRGAL